MDSSANADQTITYDGATFLVRGNRVLILAGSVHYPRVHPSRWGDIFDTFRAARLNTIETYVFWGEHYRAPADPGAEPDYDFSGRLDLFGFLRAAHDAGLYAILRIGPYVCAEVSYGGFPFALRDVPGMRFRTLNKPFQDAVARWMRLIAEELHAQKLLAPAGGPVMLVQLENEYQMIAGAYGDDGARYLQWCSDLQHELNFGVPTIMCYGSADGAVETINAFYAHELVDDLRKNRPNQPAVWTECWTGWYDVWGAPHHRRPIDDLAYSVARFFAVGGGGNNYYMWMGGSNFGRTPMYLQATSYDYDAPIDEFCFQTTKSKHLSALHNVLLDRYAPLLFERGDAAADERVTGGDLSLSLPTPVQLAEDVRSYTWSKNLVFVCNDSERMPSGEISLADCDYLLSPLPPRSVRIVDPTSRTVLYDSFAVSVHDTISRERHPAALASGSATLTDWFSWPESLPNLQDFGGPVGSSTGSSPRKCAVGDTPPEQLGLTGDMSDYCFYTATYQWTSDDARASALASGIELSMEACDFVYVYISGSYFGRSEEPLWEDRKNNKWNTKPGMPGFKHSISGGVGQVASGDSYEFTIILLVCSLGLVKADWQLGDGASANMLEEKKGLLSDVSISINGQGASDQEPIAERTIAACRKSPWTAVAGLAGEASCFPANGIGRDSLASKAPEWKGREHPVWHETTVETPDLKTSWQLDLGGMGKGLLWVNGHLLGRYWNVRGTRPRNGFLDDAPITQDTAGTPTQRYYHIPPWVVPSNKDMVSLRITLFEERGANPCEADISLVYVE